MLPIDDQLVLRLYHLLRERSSFMVLQPKSIDGDSMGAGVAWVHALRSIGKRVVHVAPGPVPRKYHFLDGWRDVTTTMPALSTIDVTLVSDMGDLRQSGLGPEMEARLQRETYLVDFDHHRSNGHFGQLNLVVPESAATTQLLTHVLRKLGIRVTAPMATALLMGLYTDTGSFRHDNTTVDTLEVAAWLLGRGADAARIAKENFQTMPLSQLRLWGRVLSRAERNELGVVSSYLTERDFDELGATPAEVEGVIDYLNAVPESPFSLLVTDRGGQLKGSLRTQSDRIDLTEVAATWGGGGHRKASGFTVPNARLRIEGRSRLVEAVPA